MQFKGVISLFWKPYETQSVGKMKRFSLMLKQELHTINSVLHKVNVWSKIYKGSYK
jgi:hypothetical protein